VTSLVLQGATALHLLSVAVFVGSNVFLSFIFSPRLELIPPGQAARLSEKVGGDFALLNWVALLVLLASGAVLVLELDLYPQLLTADFYATGYGSALATMMALGITVVVCSAVLTFYLRPRVLVKLPAETAVYDIEPVRLRSIAMATRMRWLARYNLFASALAIVAGGSIRWGGFF
jgi:uncharacterized membrane protein